MKFKFRHLETIVGVFVIVSILAIIFAVFAVGKGQRWFEKSYPYLAVFSSNIGLNPGAAVQMMGINIGEVTSVSLNNENQIEVHFKISERYLEKIRSDSVARVTTPSLLGGKILEITVGSPLLSPVEPGSIIPSEEGGGIAEILKSGKLESILAQVDATIYHIRQLSEKLVLASEKLDLALNNVVTITNRIQGGKGSLGKILSDRDNLYQELATSLQIIRESLENLKTTTEEIRKTTPDARRLVERSEESLLEVQRLIKALQKTWPLSRKVPKSPSSTEILIDTRDNFYPKQEKTIEP